MRQVSKFGVAFVGIVKLYKYDVTSREEWKVFFLLGFAFGAFTTNGDDADDDDADGDDDNDADGDDDDDDGGGDDDADGAGDAGCAFGAFGDGGDGLVIDWLP